MSDGRGIVKEKDIGEDAKETLTCNDGSDESDGSVVVGWRPPGERHVRQLHGTALQVQCQLNTNN